MTSVSSSFSSLDGIGSNIHDVGFDDLTSLYNYSSPIVEKEWNCSDLLLLLTAAWLQFYL